MTATGPTIIGLRFAGIVLVGAGFLLDSSGMSWLLTGHAPDADFLHPAVLTIRWLLIVAGASLCIWPPGVLRSGSYTNSFVGFAFAVFAVVAVARLGASFKPGQEHLFPTPSNFTCVAADPFCNRALAAGLADTPLYGRAAAFVDADTDGRIDLFVTSAGSRDEGSDRSAAWFYINNGDSTFRPVHATELGIAEADLTLAWSASFADMDNDGDQDAALVSGGEAGEANFSLYENRIRELGNFVAVAGLDAVNARPQHWSGAAWADYDNDGLLDLALTAMRGPARLLHNEGGNRFREVSRAVGIATHDALHWGGRHPVWIDFDNDGDQDLYFAGVEHHMFYENLAGKAFRDITTQIFEPVFSAGVLAENVAYKKAAPVVFAAAAADFNQDGYDDLYLGRDVEQDVILINSRRGGFLPVRAAMALDDRPISEQDRSGNFENTAGLAVGDILDDGWPDIVIGTGNPVRVAADIVYCNRAGVLERCTEWLTGSATEPRLTRGRGIAFGDANADGAIDMLLVSGGNVRTDRRFGIDSRERGALFIRNRPAGLKTATLLLEGSASNRDGIGARLRVTTDNVTRHYTVGSVQTSLGQSERAVIIALGEADRADVEIDWPGGALSKHQVRAGERRLLRE